MNGRLRNAASARVPDAKVRDYLLNPLHPQNGGKAGFFIRFGFSSSLWTILRDVLRAHPLSARVTDQTRSLHGEKFVLEGPVTSPDGRNPNITTVWIIEINATAPIFVTAFPARKQASN